LFLRIISSNELVVRVGAHLSFGGADDAESLKKIVEKVEEFGFHGLFVSEGISDQPLDPFSILSLASTYTQKIALGVVEYSITLRHPVVTAKSVSSLQRLSDGRVILGVDFSKGESDSSTTYSGVLGALESECLELMKKAWREDPLSYSGRFFKVEGMRVSSQLPEGMDPSVWIEGKSTLSVMSAAHYGSGLMPKEISPEEVRRLASQIKAALRHEAPQKSFVLGVRLPLVLAPSRHRAEVVATYFSKRRGETLEEFSSHCLVGDASQVTERLTSYFEAGANYAVISTAHFEDKRSQLETLLAFSKEVAPSL